MISQYILNSTELTEEQLARADTSGDGKVDLTDTALFQRYLEYGFSPITSGTRTKSQEISFLADSGYYTIKKSRRRNRKKGF